MQETSLTAPTVLEYLALLPDFIETVLACWAYDIKKSLHWSIIYSSYSKPLHCYIPCWDHHCSLYGATMYCSFMHIYHVEITTVLCMVLPCRPIPRWWARHPTRGTSAASESLYAPHAAGGGWVETAGPTTVSEHCHGNHILCGWS